MTSLPLSVLDPVQPASTNQQLPETTSHPQQTLRFSQLDQAALEAAVGLTALPPQPYQYQILPQEDDHLSQITAAELSHRNLFDPQDPHEFDQRNTNHLPPLPADRPHAHNPPQQQQEKLSPNNSSSNPSALPKSLSLPCTLSNDALSPITQSVVHNSLSNDPSLSAMSDAPSSPSRTESAVDRARRLAEDFTKAQLARKRKCTVDQIQAAKRRKSSSCSDNELDNHDVDDARPETVSHRKYQKRLQKNRDSAFVSRIRRREYTRVLEESLLRVEREKDAAVRSFLEMKQKFEVASAELNGLKQASGLKQAPSPNFANRLRDGVIAQLMGHHIGSGASDPQLGMPRRSGSAATMFMFTFMFGVMIPEFIKSKLESITAGTGRLGFLSKLSSGGSNLVNSKVHHGIDKQPKTSGSVWGMQARQSSGMYRVLPPKQQLLATLRADAERLSREKATVLASKIETYLEGLSEKDAQHLFTQLQQTCTKGDRGAARLQSFNRLLEDSGNGDHDDVQDLMRGLGCLTIAEEL